MNVFTATRQMLLGVPEVADLVDRIDTHLLEEEVKGTGGVVPVLMAYGEWDVLVSNARFPRVMIRVHADATRESGKVVVADEHDRALEVWDKIDRVLHRPLDREPEFWGDVWILGRDRDTEPSFITRSGEDIAMLQCGYSLKVAP